MQEDWRADQAMQAELEALRRDVGPTWLQASAAAGCWRLAPGHATSSAAVLAMCSTHGCIWSGRLVCPDRQCPAHAGCTHLPPCRPVPPSCPQEPASIEETAERHVRPALRSAFVDLCHGSVADYLARFGFRSDMLKVMYAVSKEPLRSSAGCGGGCGAG